MIKSNFPQAVEKVVDILPFFTGSTSESFPQAVGNRVENTDHPCQRRIFAPEKLMGKPVDPGRKQQCLHLPLLLSARPFHRRPWGYTSLFSTQNPLLFLHIGLEKRYETAFSPHFWNSPQLSPNISLTSEQSLSSYRGKKSCSSKDFSLFHSLQPTTATPTG